MGTTLVGLVGSRVTRRTLSFVGESVRLSITRTECGRNVEGIISYNCYFKRPADDIIIIIITVVAFCDGWCHLFSCGVLVAESSWWMYGIVGCDIGLVGLSGPCTAISVHVSWHGTHQGPGWCGTAVFGGVEFVGYIGCTVVPSGPWKSFGRSVVWDSILRSVDEAI